MSMTGQRMNQILRELEGEAAVSAVGEEMQENSGQAASGQPKMEALASSRRQMNELYEVKTVVSVSSGKPVIGKVITVIKRVVQKVISSVTAPVWLGQNRFNAAAATTVNQLCENQIKIVEFMKKQETINLENRLLHEEVERLRQELAETKVEAAKLRRQLSQGNNANETAE